VSTKAARQAAPVLTVLPTILRVRADQPTFRDVTFTSGFNVVLAERTKESTKKDSRNGLGKSTLIEIISFCLGSSFHEIQPSKSTSVSY
jgi:uncharacterized protein YydD (DUF2326 family)